MTGAKWVFFFPPPVFCMQMQKITSMACIAVNTLTEVGSRLSRTEKGQPTATDVGLLFFVVNYSRMGRTYFDLVENERAWKQANDYFFKYSDSEA